MKANVGDWLVIKNTTTEHSPAGLITEVHSADGSPPYVVRWRLGAAVTGAEAGHP